MGCGASVPERDGGLQAGEAPGETRAGAASAIVASVPASDACAASEAGTEVSRAKERGTALEMEQDTEDREDNLDYDALLLPGGRLPTACARFTLSVNYSLLRGWIKQPSPCCAAASLAGAVNALRGVTRGQEGAWDHRDVLDIMAGILQAQADKLRASAERCLGASLAPLLVAVEHRLAEEQMTLDQKQCTKKQIVVMVRDITSRQCAAAEPPVACFSLLKELMDAEAAGMQDG